MAIAFVHGLFVCLGAICHVLGPGEPHVDLHGLHGPWPDVLRKVAIEPGESYMV